ncbi:MAG: DNA polymerase I, partial [Sedimentisphaerales bacterium]|nr:DNA polymerase I [Sedimentisphaerales bacterium]
PPFRAEIYPDYKAHRPPMPEDMPPQIDRIEEILEAMRIPMLRVDGFEADDLIGTLTAKAAGQGLTSYICSKDKDMLQLLDEHTRMLDIKTGQETTRDSLGEETGLTPEQFVDVLALQGDTSDNIPGVPDVGPKTAMQWIQKYGSLDGLYAHADEIGGKRGDNLRSHKEQAYLSRELVLIHREAPVEVDAKQFALKEPDSQMLAQLFTELDFSRLLTQFGLSRDQAVLTARTEDPTATAAAIETGDREYQLIDTEETLKPFAAQLKKQKIFAVDTETTGTDPMRAELVGMSFSWQAGKAWYLAIRAPLGQKHLEIASVRKQIGPVLADAGVKKVGQNIKYDMLVLEGAQMPVSGIHFDTMVASYCLDADRSSHGMDSMARDYLGIQTIPLSSLIGKGKNQLTFDMVDTRAACEYAAEDADVTWRLYEYLRPKLEAEPKLKTLFEEVEMPLVSVLATLEKNGVSLDVPLLRRMSHEISEELEMITNQIHALAEGPFNIDSPRQLAEILFDRLGLRSIKEGKTQRSTDAGVLEELQFEHPIVPLILQYRQLGKLKNTYLDKLGGMINPRTDRLHASFNQTVTATGRLSSSDPNLQNIPIRTEQGRKIRSAFVPARQSDCILSADYSQIELRLLAHFSRDAALRKAFAEDQDIHRFVASQVYGVKPEEVTSKMRSNAKAVNFGIIYGQGPFGLSRTIGISLGEAKQFIEDYYARYSSIRTFMDNVIARTKKAGYAETILGRRRPITGLDSRNFNRRSQAQRLAVNTVIQGSAADLIKVAMIRIQQRIEKENLPVQMILQIHDELVFELPRKEAKTHAAWITQEMAHAIELDVPMKVDVAIGASWLGEE